MSMIYSTLSCVIHSFSDYISVYLKLISQLKAVKAIDNESEDLRRDCDNVSQV